MKISRRDFMKSTLGKMGLLTALAAGNSACAFFGGGEKCLDRYDHAVRDVCKFGESLVGDKMPENPVLERVFHENTDGDNRLLVFDDYEVRAGKGSEKDRNDNLGTLNGFSSGFSIKPGRVLVLKDPEVVVYEKGEKGNWIRWEGVLGEKDFNMFDGNSYDSFERVDKKDMAKFFDLADRLRNAYR